MSFTETIYDLGYLAGQDCSCTDGSYLYTILSNNRLIKINLSTGIVDLDVDTGVDSLLGYDSAVVTGGYIYVITNTDTISKIDASTGSVVDSIFNSGFNYYVIETDGTDLFVVYNDTADFRYGKISISTFTETSNAIATYQANRQDGSELYGNYLYILYDNSGENGILKIDKSTLAEVGSPLVLGFNRRSLTASQDGNYLYTVEYGSSGNSAFEKININGSGQVTLNDSVDVGADAALMYAVSLDDTNNKALLISSATDPAKMVQVSTDTMTYDGVVHTVTETGGASQYINGVYTAGAHYFYIYPDGGENCRVIKLLDEIFWNITVTASPSGSILDEGVQVIGNSNDSTVVTLSAAPFRYRMDRVLIDGNDVGRIETYQFTNVISNHTLHVDFKRIVRALYTIK